jgi:FlaA1/EpsC-like NDP-sugar epimerase
MLLDQRHVGDRAVALTGVTGSSFAPAAVRPRSLGRRAEPSWVRSYTTSLAAFETLVAAVVGGATVLGRAGSLNASSLLLWAAAALVVAWPTLLAATGAYSERVYGTGSDEYRRVGRAGFMLLALTSILSYAAALDLSRIFVAVAIPALTAVSLLGRYAARIQLRRRRARGLCTKRVVVVGRGGAVLELVAHVRRAQYAGMDVVAACVTPGDRARVAACPSEVSTTWCPLRPS